MAVIRWARCGALVGLLGALGCSGDTPNAGMPVAGADRRNVASGPVLRVGTSGDYAPFSLQGQGFDIEVARRFAEDSGYRIEWIPFRWPQLQADVRADRFDVAMSGVTWRPDRAVVGQMTRAVAVGGPCLLGDREAAQIGVNQGGFLERFARAEFAERRLVLSDDNLALPSMLAEGRVGAIVTDSFELASFRAELASRLGDAPRAGDGSEFCWPASHRKVYWVAPGAPPELASRLDAWLAENEPWLRATRQRFFGQEQPRLPLDHLIDLVTRRLAFMPAVGAWKRARGLPIEDLERERVVLDRVAEQASELGLPAKEVRRFFELQILWAKALQARTQPPETLDLRAQIRPVLLELGDAVLEALVAFRDAGGAERGAPDSMFRDRLAPLEALLLPHEIGEFRAALGALAAVGPQSHAGSWFFTRTFVEYSRTALVFRCGSQQNDRLGDTTRWVAGMPRDCSASKAALR